jgi:hypothetical protein
MASLVVVRDIMSKDVQVVRPDTTAQEVVATLSKFDIGSRALSDLDGWWRCFLGGKNAEYASKFLSERKCCDGGSVSVFAESTVHRLHSHVCRSDLCDVFVQCFNRRNHDDCYVCYSSLQRGTMANAAVWENLC